MDDLEGWVTDLEEGDVVTLRVGETDVPHKVEIGADEFDTDGIDRIEVVVRDVKGWYDHELSEGESYSLVVEFVDDDLDDEIGAVATGGTLQLGGSYNLYDLTLDVPATMTERTMSSAHLEVSPGIPDEMRSYREAAKSEADSLRSKSMRRVIYADTVARYAASEEKGGVWGDYSSESDEASVSGFVEWLEVETLREMWSELGEEMFPDENDLFDVEDRALADTLSMTRYFSYRP